ncbi:telomere length regulation protein TEL2 homolog [Diachasmimorpha longicaudata]|uniref:telomere length regulation protein TEL2 homolog n=1 Tax=Diachasmimorpha longicaudata TaxID=58733 RepID=UPI0030B8E44A
MEATGKQLLDVLTCSHPFSSEKSLAHLENAICQYTKFLEKSVNQQTDSRFTGCESTIDESQYGKILRTFLSTFDENFSILKQRLNTAIQKLMIIKGCNFLMLHELLTSISEYLKGSTQEDAVQYMILLLEKILKSDALLSSLVSICKVQPVNDLERDQCEEARRDCIQLVISLPVKVSNKAKGRVPETFSIRNFSKIISFQIVGAIKSLSEERNKRTTVCDVKALSLFISKLLSNYGSENFGELIKIMVRLSLEDKNSLRQLIEDILMNISRGSIPSVAVLLLENIEDPNHIQTIFGNLMKHENWKFVLTKKFLFFSYFKSNKIVINLINCLLCEDSERNFVNLITKLLDIWGDKSALNHTSQEQQEFITKIILLLIKKGNGRLKSIDKDSIRELLIAGTSAHLESMHLEIRAIGMITGELIINYFDAPDRPTLKYDYESMPKEGVNIVSKLKKFWSEEFDRSYDFSSDKNVTSDVLIRKLGVKSTILSENETINVSNKEIPEISDYTTDNSQEDKADDEIIKGNSQLCSGDDANEESLDSDDDLIPYDMSNDTKSHENHRPMYLRELKENLVDRTDTTDGRIFAETLECSEKLLKSQLPNDDSSLGLELLALFSKLTETTHVENFQALKFRACVTITKIHPKVSAEYLCREFHAPLGRNSVSDRLFFLNVLQEAARQLSKIEVNETESGTEMNSTNVGRKNQIKSVAKPISLFLNSEVGKKIETLYDDDDFQICQNFDAENFVKMKENQSIIARRTGSKSRVIAHPSKRSPTTINKFNDVASYFFYPLFYGLSAGNQNIFNTPRHFEDHSNLLLINFIKTLSTIMVAAENCTVAPKMARELLEFAWTMRFHEQDMVKYCIIESIAAVFVVSKSNFTDVIIDLLLELRTWLTDICDESSKGESSDQCRSMAINVINLIDSLFPRM